MPSLFERSEKRALHFLDALQSDTRIWLSFLFALVLVLNGPDITDGDDFLVIAQHPFQMIAAPERQFLYSSPLNFILAGLTGLNNVFGFYALHGAEILAMLICVAFSVRHKITKPQQQAVFLTLISLTPLWLVIIKWFGKSDPVLIGGLFLCWAFRSRWRVAIAVMMILAHREIGSLIIVSLYLLEDKKDSNFLIAFLTGNALQMLYQYGILDHAPQSRPELVIEKARGFLHAITAMPVLYVMSLFTWYWTVIVKRRLATIEAGILLVAFCLALITEDFTRVFILLAMPAILFHAERLALSKDGLFWKDLWVLTPLQFQIAVLGHVAYADNALLNALVR